MIKDLKEKIEKIDAKVLIGAAVGGVALLSFFVYKFMSKTKGETPKALPTTVKRVASSVSHSRKSQQPTLPEGPQRALIRVINQIKKNMPDKDTINYEAVKKIYQGQFQLSKAQAQALIKKNRNQRRQLLGDLKGYLDIVANYEQSLEEIHNGNLNAILAYFRIDKGGWIELIEEVSIQNKDDWDQLLIDTQDQEIDSLRQKEKPKLKLPILIQIFKHKAEQLSKKINEFKTNFAGTDPSTLYTMVEKWTADITYEKFKVEVEDINYSYKELSEKDKQQLKDHQKVVNELIEGLVLGDQDDEEDGQQADNNSQQVHSNSRHSKQEDQEQS